MSIREILEGRGIAQSAERFEWRERVYYGAKGWMYPVYAWSADWITHISSTDRILGHRWKAASKEEASKLEGHLKGVKYLWIPAKPKAHDADWYILPPAFQAIHRAGGIAYMVNGEPALLAMNEAGIENAITTTLSEISVPPNAVLMLQNLGIKRLLYISDRDRAGVQSAAKWQAHLTESGIDFTPLELPDLLGSKADVNDLWIDAAFNRQQFKQSLEALPRLIIPKDESRPKPVYGERIVNTDIASAIASHYNLLGTRVNPSNGYYYRSVCCPFHEDSRASAGVHAQKGILHCHVCGSFGYKEHAARIGIDLNKFEPERKASNPVDRSINDSERGQYLVELLQVYKSLQSQTRKDNRRLHYTDEHPTIKALTNLLLLRQRLEQGFRVHQSEYGVIKTAQSLLTGDR